MIKWLVDKNLAHFHYVCPIKYGHLKTIIASCENGMYMFHSFVHIIKARGGLQG